MSSGYRSRHHSHGTRSVRDRPPSPHPSHLSRKKSRDTTTSGSADSRFSDDDKQDEVSLLCCTIPSDELSLDSLTVRIIIGVIICILAFVTGFLIGYFAMPSVVETNVESSSNARAAPVCPKATNMTKKVESRNIKLTPVYIPPVENFTIPYAAINEVRIDNLKHDLNEIAGSTHAAWQERDQELALMIEKRWSDSGLDSVQMVKYNVLLNYPDSAHPNKVQVIEHPAKFTITAANKERGRWKGDIDKNTIDAYSAYSRSGEIKARPVYVNYGREEDFEMLARYRVDASGTICIIRYGKITPGLKVRNAEMADAAGVILYPDPADVAPNGTDEMAVYPFSEMLPPDGIRRGSVLFEMGDPQTPFWPSIEGVYRIPLENTSVPKIVVQPISYNDAGKILDKMQGRVPPPDWIGGLRKYRMGPGFEKQRGREPTLVVTVNNIFKLQTVYNVIGMIQGREEPDRYVIEGNHRDAWSQGTSDPSSGTAQLLETVRIFAEMKKNGWRPRRTLIFASWGAEELGEMGSQEWVEEHLVELSIRGVAYINTDTCVSGPHLEISSSPLLTQMVFDASKMISHPSKANATLFDELTNGVNKTEEELKSEWSDNLSYDSDIGPFLYLAGIPSINVWFRRNKTENGSKNKFPAYHTAYDTLHRMTNFVDPDYHLHKACTQLSLALVLNAADSPLIPLNPTSLGQIMKKGLEHLRSEEISMKLIHLGVDIGPLRRAVDEFIVAADEWTEQLKTDNESVALRRRLLNDQLMLLKNSLLLPEGEAPNFRLRHAIYSPAIRDSYVTTTFAKIVDLLNEGPEAKIRLNIYVTKVMVQIRQAISALTPF